jgi:predicted nuclease of predicted toxin-antitoxin system
MKVLLDMNLSPDWASFLKKEGFEAVHWATVGAPTASDAAIMEWARHHEHVVFTHDMDFSALLAVTGATGPSVLQVRAQDVLPEAIGRDVVRVLTMRAEAFEMGAIVTLDKVKSRVRVLPIRRGATDPEPI